MRIQVITFQFFTHTTQAEKHRWQPWSITICHIKPLHVYLGFVLGSANAYTRVMVSHQRESLKSRNLSLHLRDRGGNLRPVSESRQFKNDFLSTCKKKITAPLQSIFATFLKVTAHIYNYYVIAKKKLPKNKRKKRILKNQFYYFRQWERFYVMREFFIFDFANQTPPYLTRLLRRYGRITVISYTL